MVGKIDGKVATNLAKEFRVQDFPTLFFYTSKQFHWYDGPGDLEGMLKWVELKHAFSTPIFLTPLLPGVINTPVCQRYGGLQGLKLLSESQ